MEHLLPKSKFSIFLNIFKYVIFQRRQKALLWSEGLKRDKKQVVLLLSIVFSLSCGCNCSMSLSRGAVGWSSVCDCGISWSYSLSDI